MARYVHPPCDGLQLRALESVEGPMFPKGSAQESEGGCVKFAVGGGAGLKIDLAGLVAVDLGKDAASGRRLPIQIVDARVYLKSWDDLGRRVRGRFPAVARLRLGPGHALMIARDGRPA